MVPLLIGSRLALATGWPRHYFFEQVKLFLFLFLTAFALGSLKTGRVESK